MSKRIEHLYVIDNKHITNDIFILNLSSHETLPEMKPGQFVQVRVDGSPDTFLRRPFSVHDVNYENKSFRLLVQIAGNGTKKLSELNSGDSINVVYPLGNSFSVPESGERILLVGGGCGIAPLLFLGKYFSSRGIKFDILLGFRNIKRIIEIAEYEQLGTVFLTTEDGSAGTRGFVTDHPALVAGKYDKVYCCGPEPMMKAVAAFCKKNAVECEVSLENLMGCGFGVCLCCVVDTINGHVCTCTDGPVFNTKTLKW